MWTRLYRIFSPHCVTFYQLTFVSALLHLHWCVLIIIVNTVNNVILNRIPISQLYTHINITCDHAAGFQTSGSTTLQIRLMLMWPISSVNHNRVSPWCKCAGFWSVLNWSCRHYSYDCMHGWILSSWQCVLCRCSCEVSIFLVWIGVRIPAIRYSFI